MKLVFQNDVAPTFGVDFHGVKLIVPRQYLCGYLAMDSDFVVHVHESKPVRSHDGEEWLFWGNPHESLVVATVETDMDWKDTLVSIDSNKVTKYLR